MTNFDWKQKLTELISFLPPEEIQIVSSYLDGRLSEENGDKSALQSPSFLEAFSEKLRISYEKNESPLSQLLPALCEEALQASSDSPLEDVIFSKPLAAEKAPELIHSLEDKEVKTLYGEKVAVEGHDIPEESHMPEPIDMMNGLTEEEIQLAKEHTLEKTEHFQEKEMEETPKKYLLEEEDVDLEAQPAPVDEKPKKRFPGLLNEAVKKITKETEVSKTILILLSILVSPVLLVLICLGLAAYAAVSLGIILVSLVLFLAMILVVTAGVVELVYGFLILFDNVPAALVELGFGTMLIAVVISITALIYEFIFGIVPKLLRLITKKSKESAVLLKAYLFGGEA